MTEVVKENSLKKVLFRACFKNDLNWYALFKLWFLVQRLSDHLTKKVSKIYKEIKDNWEVADYQLVSLL